MNVKKLHRMAICCIVLIVLLGGCTDTAKEYILPDNYEGDASVRVCMDQTDNVYDLKIICKENSYDLTINKNDMTWSMLWDGNNLILKNDKFKENSVVIDDLKIFESLIYELDLGKFKNRDKTTSSQITYEDGIYKHILTFNKNKLLPETIFIYKNDILVKTIEYDNVKVQQL